MFHGFITYITMLIKISTAMIETLSRDELIKYFFFLTYNLNVIILFNFILYYLCVILYIRLIFKFMKQRVNKLK